MLEVRRLKGVGVVLTLAAIVTSAHVWGDPRKEKDKELRDFRAGGRDTVDKGRPEDQVVNRFADVPLTVYQSVDGEFYYALQVQPALQPTPPRPRDILVLIDTSASKAQGPLALATKIT